MGLLTETQMQEEKVRQREVCEPTVKALHRRRALTEHHMPGTGLQVH